MAVKKQVHIIGIDEAGRAARRRASFARPSYILGIDEAGRGPLAGPVVVAGIKIKSKINLRPELRSRENQKSKFWEDIRDSKKLSAKKREEWFKLLTSHPEIEWAAAKVWPKTIDRINIARAANLGARRVYAKLAGDEMPFALLDGSLYLSAVTPYKTIIKGDEKIPVISAASIIAKVIRDSTMRRLHKKYPQYGFDRHKGYGTKLHRKMIKKFGRSEAHRISFRTA